MAKKVVGISLVVVFLALTGCKKKEKKEEAPTPEELLQTSLHHTTAGMAYFYSKDQGGFENISNIPYENLTCYNCHVETNECSSCHTEGTSSPPPDDACLACHGRQNKEIMLGYSDVHRDAGKTCADCHKSDDAHGDGNSYNSMLEGAIHVECEDCHENLPSNSSHDQHLDELHCSACHVKSTVTCYNCHFESEVNQGQKVAYGAFHEWKFLVKWNGKVHAGNIMTITYQGKAFVVAAPFFGHTVYKPDPATICSECHQNQIVQEYNQNGTMTAVWWDDSTQALSYFKETIPLPFDWQTALKFSYVTKDTQGAWVHLKDDADLKQILFAEPLDELPPQW